MPQAVMLEAPDISAIPDFGLPANEAVTKQRPAFEMPEPAAEPEPAFELPTAADAEAAFAAPEPPAVEEIALELEPVAEPEPAAEIAPMELVEIDADRLTRADRWILARLDAAIGDCDAALGPPRPRNGHWTEAERTAGLRLNDYADSARRFVWNELADWYLEAVKARLTEDSDDREVARAVLVHAFDGALRLLHPIVPFVTEALWQKLTKGVIPSPSTSLGVNSARDLLLATSKWPVAEGQGHLLGAREFDYVVDAVLAVEQR